MGVERFKSLAMSVGLLLASAGALVGTSSATPAAAQGPEGSFTCRASAVSLLGVEAVVANPGGAPCLEESRSAADLPVGSLSVRAPSARTQLLPAVGGATSLVHLAGVDVAALGLRADVVEAEAVVTCAGDQPRLSGTSKVVGLTVEGRAVPSDAPADVPLAAGTLRLNRTIAQSGALVVRAVELTTPLGVVILGEARIGATGNPCESRGDEGRTPGPGTVTIVKVAEPQGSGDFSFTGGLGSFSLRDSGRPDGADRRTFSMPGGAYRITEGGMTTGPFAFAWSLRDVRCVDPDGGTTVDLRNGSVQVDLDAGENIVCTFTNRNDRLTRELARTGGLEIELTSRGLDPVADKQGAALPPQNRGGVQPPSPRTIPPARPEDPVAGTNASFLPSGALIGLPLVALVAGGTWFLLAAGRRRREAPT